MPYHVFGARSGATSETIAWMRSARARSSGGISAILARSSFSPAARSLPRFCSALSSAARSLTAARSSGDSEAVVFVAAFLVVFFAMVMSPSYVRREMLARERLGLGDQIGRRPFEHHLAA